MPPPFQKITLAQFEAALRQFHFTRKIESVHIHHTWRPNHSQFKGLDSIEAMWEFHTKTNGWSDIAQHITIDPEGFIWTGRNWNRAPASASGFNGSSKAGPFMFEMIGDFDQGKDRFEGQQRETALHVIALVQKHFDLAPETLKFHNQMSEKTCPGSALDYAEIVADVRALHSELAGSRALPAAGSETEIPFGAEALESNGGIRELLPILSQDNVKGDDPAGAELAEESTQAEHLRDLYGTRSVEGGKSQRGARFMVRADDLTPELLQDLRPHVINLNKGEFSENGRFSTTRGDVDAIFDDYLERYLQDKKQGEPLRIVIYAHGGLVNEVVGLRIARNHVQWWQRNGCYPLYFVWETGFVETIKQLFQSSRSLTQRAGARDFWDFTLDPLTEGVVRHLGGVTIWSGIKNSADLAARKALPNGEAGGAYYVAQRLKAFCDRHKETTIELHAIGHSAGSNFHCQFLPTALDLGVPSFKSLTLFAPAVRVDTFKQQLGPRLGRDKEKSKGIDKVTIFTMQKDQELADSCGPTYHKSLLYLVHHACETQARTPLLGLDVSLRGDAELRDWFGLNGRPSAKGEVVWSVTRVKEGRSATTSTEHGGFDEDAPTLNSTLRRVLDFDDNDAITPFVMPPQSRGAGLWEEPVDLPEDVATLLEAFASASAASPVVTTTVSTTVSATTPSGAAVPVSDRPEKPGRKRALCIGIDTYRRGPLSGCVNDAELWARTLMELGFENPAMLRNEEATHENILRSLRGLVMTSRPGDVLAFQYAGHGTTLPDKNAEASEAIIGKDEAICPFDYTEGAFLIDDDIGAVFDQLPAGVSLTCFIDCCHSGTITRFAIGATEETSRDVDERPRFIVPTSDEIAAYRRFRSGRRSLHTRVRNVEQMQEVLFAACLASEVAWEKNGQGDFTRAAIPILRSGFGRMTNTEFQAAVTAAFGATPRQHPGLYCAPTLSGSRLLAQAVSV